MQNYDIKEIKLKLQNRIYDVVRYLLPNGKKYGSEWVTGDVNDSAGKSLKVNLNRDKAGVWCDFATGDHKGDIINLWSVVRGCNYLDAIEEIKKYLGIALLQSQFYPSPCKKKYVTPQLSSSAVCTLMEAGIKYLINERKLTQETINKYKVVTTKEEIIFPYYRDNKLIMIKYLKIKRINGEKEMRAAPNCEPCLFGWQAMLNDDIRSAVIVEGEIDAMTLHQYGIPYVIFSVPYGGGKGAKQQWIEYEFDKLANYEEIFLCLDFDKEGQIATQEIAKRLGMHRCRIVKLPYNDANECLQNNVTKQDLEKCFNLAATLDPAELKPASIFLEETIKEFSSIDEQENGYRLPWEKTFKKVQFRSNELSVWTGINGHGKSLLLGQVMLGFMKQGAKVCIASLETRPRKVLVKLIQQTAGFKEPTKEYIDAIFKWYDGKLWLFNVVGNAKTEQLLEIFKYAVKKYNINVFLIDSFLKCGIKEDDYNNQKIFVEQLCDFVHEYDCHIHLVVHPRKGDDEGNIPGKLDIKGTGSVTDLAHNCFSVWRHKKKEEIIQNIVFPEIPTIEWLEKCDCVLKCNKQRHGDWEGSFSLWFHADSYRFIEKYGERQKSLVDYFNPISNNAVY